RCTQCASCRNESEDARLPATDDQFSDYAESELAYNLRTRRHLLMECLVRNTVTRYLDCCLSRHATLSSSKCNHRYLELIKL
ncbi:hypothetical protein PENTCL1PPCAC_14548, partial [Pristionchus entomophagus]